MSGRQVSLSLSDLPNDFSNRNLASSKLETFADDDLNNSFLCGKKKQCGKKKKNTVY